MVQILDLPNELFFHIFSHLDGGSLKRIQRVCTLWKKLVEDLCQDWKRICVSEIPKESLQELVGFKDIKALECKESSSTQLSFDWFSLYQRWYRLTKVSSKEASVTCFEAMVNSPVTCLKITNAFIVTGHRTGDVFLWDTENFHSVHLTSHEKMVTDLVLVSTDFGNCCSNNVGIKKFIFGNSHHLITSSTDYSIHIVPLTDNCLSGETSRHVEYFGNRVHSVKVFNRILTALTYDSILFAWEMSLAENGRMILRKLFQHVLHTPHFGWIGFWQNKVRTMSSKKIVEEVSLPANSKLDVIKSRIYEITQAEDSDEEDDYYYVTNVLLYRRNVVIMLTTGDFFIAADSGTFHRFYSLLFLKSRVTSACLYGNLLALGLERGALYLYHIPEHLEKLDLSKPCLKKTLSEASVIALDVNFLNNEPCVVAATTSDVYIIKWNV